MCVSKKARTWLWLSCEIVRKNAKECELCGLIDALPLNTVLLGAAMMARKCCNCMFVGVFWCAVDPPLDHRDDQYTARCDQGRLGDGCPLQGSVVGGTRVMSPPATASLLLA